MLTKLLSSQPASSYSACASELLRRLNFKTHRASVRRWAIQNHLAPDTRYKATPKPVKRWQACEEGALWQYDASPHPWLPDNPSKQALFDILDDATRYNTGTRLYPRETLLSHFDFLPRTFQAHGLPLALYVDYHSFFYTHNPDAFTQLGAALHFYGVALRFAPTPQAKGKIERRHDYWQKRLPPLLAADCILELEGANRLLDQLLPHVNQHEIHRELGITPPPHVSKPAPKNARSCVPSPTARGGPLSGVSAPTSASAMTVKSPSAPSASRLICPTPSRVSSLPASGRRHLLSPPCPRPQNQTHRSAPLPSLLTFSAFDRTLFSAFECYTTQRVLPLDGCEWFPQSGPMPRTMRVEYPGAIYQVMDREGRREDIMTAFHCGQTIR